MRDFLAKFRRGRYKLGVDEKGSYRFLNENQNEKHYAVVFLENNFSSINSNLNSLLNYFVR